MNDSEFPNAWSTPIAAVVAVAAGGIVLAVFAILTIDVPGRIIVGCAAVGLLGFAVLAGTRRPRLTIIADKAGEILLVVRDLRRTAHYRPADIVGIRLSRARRLGRSSAMLEIDVRDRDAERLLVFTRWDLGANPLDVLDALTAAGLTR